jgi:multidrug efflux pump subunit AcrA (membrane-fusion protein)
MSSFIEKRIEDIKLSKAETQLVSYGKIMDIGKSSYVRKWMLGIFIIAVLVLFLPWTQNIRAKGKITTSRQEDRPQELNTVIGGKVVKWYVKEGDFVNAGDTILQLGEVKVEYFDPALVARTRQQIEAKNRSREAYEFKANTADTQLTAIESALRFKLQSVDNKIGQQVMKITIDSADLVAGKVALDAYKRQITAAKSMLDSGVISLIEYEKRTINFQEGVAKVNSLSNKLEQSRQELLNLKIEKNGVLQEYNDKIAKTSGDRFSSISAAASTEADVAKLENLLTNYDFRQQLYFITAPQSGQITKARKAGIGEILKEGEMLVEIVPTSPELAVELFINPMDLPLVRKGQKVRFVFDGFPAIVFSGWPAGSFGTFGGIVSAVETSISPNGYFRILVVEDPNDQKWPPALRMGGGANGIALLKDVPIWYELWRIINGFPNEYYLGELENKPAEKK